MKALLDRYLPPAYRALFTDVFTWQDNPVLLREQRRESRRRDRAVLFLVMLGTMVAAFFASDWALRYSHDQRLMRERVPVVLGGGYPIFFFALFSGIHALFVWHATYRRSYYLLLQEYRQNSLSTLLCTRVTPFQLLLMASLHPFRQGMLVAAVGLPFYAWIMALGGVPFIDFIGLYVFFAMISFRPPRWSLPVFAGIPAEDILKRQRSGRPKTWGEWWLYNGIWILMVGGWYLQWVFGPAWMRKFLWPLTSLVSTDISRILPAFMITWVLALVRFLWHPLAYFGFHLAPIVVIVPLYLFARLMAIWESSIHLRTGDTDTSQNLWDLHEYWRMRRIYGLVLPFLLMGFLWQPYVASGLTSVLVLINGAQGDAAIAGLLYLAGSLAAMVCWARSRELSAIRTAFGGKLMGQRGGEMTEMTPAWEAWYIFSPLASILGIYAAACLLSGVWPFPGAAVRVLLALLTVTVAGVVYARGVAPGLRNYVLALIVPLAGWLIPVPAAGSLIAAISPVAGLLSLTEHTQRILTQIPTHQPEVAPWYVCAAIAAIAGLLFNYRLARRSKTAVAPDWSYGSAYNPLPAAVPSAITPELLMGRSAARSESTTEAAPPVLATPAQVELREPMAEGRPLKGKAFLRKKDTPAALRLIAWLQTRWDNALAVKELRVLLRGHLGKDEQISYGVLLLVVTVLAVVRSDISSALLEGPARLVFGSATGIPFGGPSFGAQSGATVVFGGLAAMLMLIITLVAGAASVSVCGTAFGRERDKSTLGFVLVTPMPTRAILFGKLFGMLGPTVVAVTVVFLYSFLLSIPAVKEIGLAATLLGLIYCLSLCVLIMALGGTLGLACSTVFRRETDSSAMGFLVLLVLIAVISYATGVWPDLLGSAFARDTPRQWIWLIYLALCDLALIPALLGFTHWRLTRARHGDVAFESASK